MIIKGVTLLLQGPHPSSYIRHATQQPWLHHSTYPSLSFIAPFAPRQGILANAPLLKTPPSRHRDKIYTHLQQPRHRDPLARLHHAQLHIASLTLTAIPRPQRPQKLFNDRRRPSNAWQAECLHIQTSEAKQGSKSSTASYCT